MMLAAGISSGVGISKAKIYRKRDVSLSCCRSNSIEDELMKIDICIQNALRNLQDINSALYSEYGSSTKLLDKYASIINNRFLIEDIKQKIVRDRVSAQYAIISVLDGFERMINNLDDEYLYEKCEDIEEIKQRLLSNIPDTKFQNDNAINEDCIIVARDLTLGDVMTFNPKYVKGIVTLQGGPTSSVGIIARCLNIPAVAEVGNEGLGIKNGDILIVDGNKGRVYINPDKQKIMEYIQ